MHIEMSLLNGGHIEFTGAEHEDLVLTVRDYAGVRVTLKFEPDESLALSKALRVLTELSTL